MTNVAVFGAPRLTLACIRMGWCTSASYRIAACGRTRTKWWSRWGQIVKVLVVSKRDAGGEAGIALSMKSQQVLRRRASSTGSGGETEVVGGRFGGALEVALKQRAAQEIRFSESPRWTITKALSRRAWG